MNPNPLSVFRLIVPVIEAIRDTFSTPFVFELGTDEYHTFRCGNPAHQDGIEAGPDGAPSQARCLDCHNALREVLKDAKARGLRCVEITTAVENAPSKRVIEANGGILIEEFVTPPALGSRNERRYRVPLGEGID